MTKRRAIVICPGRGTYNRDELGYLRRHHADKRDFLSVVDRYRQHHGQPPVTELDGADRYSAAVHTRGDNASPLIYACAYADYLSIDRSAFEIVAVTGNSMGWYIALACGGAASAENGLAIVNTMGTLMHDNLTGGQILYPIVDADWREVPGRRAQLMMLMADIASRPGHALSLSIDLGGMLVFAGDEAGLAAMTAALPVEQERYPMRLVNHAAFHSPLLAGIAAQGQAVLGEALFGDPAVPMIDGRGHIWRPRETRPAALRDYTLGHQVTEPYDFSRAVQSGVREFAPDALIVLGPGTTLGGAVAQSLIGIGWRGLDSKAAFTAMQAENPFVLSMGLPTQRAMATG